MPEPTALNTLLTGIRAKRDRREQRQSCMVDMPEFGCQMELQSLITSEILDMQTFVGNAAALNRYSVYLACPELRRIGKTMAEAGEIVEPIEVMHYIDPIDVTRLSAIVQDLSGIKRASDVTRIVEAEAKN